MKKRVVVVFFLILFSCIFIDSLQNIGIMSVYADETEEDNVMDDQDVTLDTSNTNLIDNFIVISDANVSLDAESGEFLEELLELGSDNTWSLLNSRGEKIACEENSCVLGTGMQILVKPVSDSEQEQTDEEGKTYYVAVIGDITGDGLVEVNDIVKYKSHTFLELINNTSDTSNLTNAYRRALQVRTYSDTSDNNNNEYTKVTVNSLIKHKLFKRTVLDIVRNISSSINLKTNDVKLGDSDNYSLNVSTEEDAIVKYESQDEEVAVVSNSGVITGRNKGETSVIVSSGTNSQSVSVQVVSAPKKISFVDESLNLLIGDEYTSRVDVSSDDNVTLNFSSSNEEVATVDSAGKVKAVSEGNATITVTTFNGKKSTCNVLVSKERAATMTTLSVSNTTGLFKHSDSVTTNDSVVDAKGIKGGSFKLSTDAKLTNNSTAKILWSSSNKDVASVDNDGLVTLNGAGTAKILATAGDNKLSYTIEVYNVSLGAESLSIKVGDSTSVGVALTNSKGKNVTDSDLDGKIELASSSYYTTSVSANKITFTAIASSENNISVNVLVDKLNIGTIILGIDSSENQSGLADFNGYVSFLPTQSNQSGYTWSESIILKSQDGSVAMIDTGRDSSSDNICDKVVFKRIKDASSASIPTLDYLIISHSHSDHTGCLDKLLGHVEKEELIIKNIVIKEESLDKKVYDSVKAANDSGKTHLIRANDLGNHSDSNVSYYQNNGNSIPYVVLGSTGKTMKLYFFNYTDVFAGNASCTKEQYSTIKFRRYSKSKANLIVSGKCSGSSDTCYPVLKTSTSTSITYTKDKDNKNYFYAMVDLKLRSICSANANSIAVLAEVQVGNDDKKYIYIPSDLENTGYPTQGSTYDAVNVTGNGNHYFYKYDKDGDKIKFTFSSGKLELFNPDKNVPIESEYKVAKQIKNNFDSSKIILYQASHHGYNVDPVSLNLLNLNNKTTHIVVLNYNALQYPYNYNLRTNRAYDVIDKVVSNKHYYRMGYYYKTNTKGFLDFKIYNSGSMKVSHSSK